MTHFTYSKIVNETPAESPLHVYLAQYWQAVSSVELEDDLQFKQTLSTSGLLGEQRLGLQTGIIEIDYSISKVGVLKIENVRAPEHVSRNQLSLARHAMQKAGRSLKPPPRRASASDEEAIRDTMVFEYR